MDVEKLAALKKKADQLRAELRPLLPRIAEARRRYATSKTDENRSQLDEVEKRASTLLEQSDEVIKAMEAASGLPTEVLSELAKPQSGDRRDRLPRRSLTVDKVQTTGDIDELLPAALDAIQEKLPKGWIDAEPRELAGLASMTNVEEFLSLTKGLRQQSEFPKMHRFRQALVLSQDYLSGHLPYDHFAGATAVPSVVQLGSQLKNLKQVGGDVDGRLGRLWSGPSDVVDATLLEVLAAARCAELGREVEFISETGEKSPDLRCHDPYPLVIECKRQQALSDYEIAEEGVMRDLFVRLRSEALRKGLAGRFSLRLEVEASELDLDEVARCLVSQRLAAHPERELAYPWGRTAFVEIPDCLDLPGPTRLYSPLMLNHVFGWRSDLPDWDGLCCSIGNARDLEMDSVVTPIGLIWISMSNVAMKRKTWAPTNLFGGATSQIPPGEFGIVYVAFMEGAREDLADLRVKAYTDRIEAWVHSGDIRIPITFLQRLYPRPLDHGNPDLIESSVRFCSEVCGEPLLFDDFPSTIFTPSK